MADYTKVTAQLLDWTLLDDFSAANPTVETAELDVSDDLQSILHIDIAHADTNAVSDAAECVVFIKSGSTDEDWHERCRFFASTKTAGKQNLAAASGPSQANPDRVEIADTGVFDIPGEVFFILDNVIANSELVVCKKAATDDYVQVMDDLTQDHTTDADLLNVVNQWSVEIPPATSKVKVMFFNRDADATYAVRVQHSKVTDIE